MLPLTSPTANIVPVQRDLFLLRVLRFCYVSRRKFATVAAVALAAVIGWHAFFGPNGVVAYQAKRRQAAELAVQMEALKKENARLAEHNGRLQNDPDAIEGAIRSHLRYAKPNEVIVTVDPPAAATAAQPPPVPQK